MMKLNTGQQHTSKSQQKTSIPKKKHTSYFNSPVTLILIIFFCAQINYNLNGLKHEWLYLQTYQQLTKV